MHRPKCEQGAFTAASSLPSLCESWFFCSIKFKNRDICCCDCHPTCPHAKNLIRTWLFGSSKCVKFRKIIFNCTIQITEEVKRCTSCSKQQDSPVINTSSVASHSWSSWKQFLTHSCHQDATRSSGEAVGSAPTLSQQLGEGECHRIVLSDSMEQLNQSSLLLDQCRAHLSMLEVGWLSVCIRDKQTLLWKERTEMDLQPQLSSVRKTPPVMILFLLPKWKGGGMPEQRLWRWQSPVSWSTSARPEFAINEIITIPKRGHTLTSDWRQKNHI